MHSWYGIEGKVHEKTFMTLILQRDNIHTFYVLVALFNINILLKYILQENTILVFLLQNTSILQFLFNSCLQAISEGKLILYNFFVSLFALCSISRAFSK